MKTTIVIGLLLLLCFPTFAADRYKIGKIRDLDRQISQLIIRDISWAAQQEELKNIKRQLDDLIIDETDPEVISLYNEVKTRLRDLYPRIE
jgi:hypothetical protein